MLSTVDDWHVKARKTGARGGKLLGADGGGFLLAFVVPDRHGAVRTALGNPGELLVRMDPRALRIVFIGKGA